MGFTPTQFEKLAINDLEYNKFVLDSNGNVAVRVSSVGGGGSITLQNIVFVSKNGNDTTGLRNRLDRPFLTIQAALDQISNQLVIIYPGEYDESISIPAGTNVFGYQGVYIRSAGTVVRITAYTFNEYNQSGIFGGITLVSSGADDAIIIDGSGKVYIDILSITKTTGSTFTNECVFRISNTNYTYIYINVKYIVRGNVISLFTKGLFNITTTSGIALTLNADFINIPGGSTISSNFNGSILINSSTIISGSGTRQWNINSGSGGVITIQNANCRMGFNEDFIVVNDDNARIISKNNTVYSDGGFNSFFAIGTSGAAKVYLYGINICNKPVDSSITELIGTLVVDTAVIPTF